MNITAGIYRPSLALLTDLYELTMAFGYWKAGMADRRAVFHLGFRENPFGGGFAVACGLAAVVDYLESFHFDSDDLAYLAELSGADGRALFSPDFLDFLRHMKSSLNVDAVPEGTVVFANEPLIRVEGPLIQSQIVESALLNIVNFQTLVATKAARVVAAARGEPVLEFGLRRAQGIDGALSASRAAYLGGCAATSNVLAGRLFGIPVRGTHAHSWIMCFDDEPEAFAAYADAMPNNCIFLVDTYDTHQGVRRAIEVGRSLRSRGDEMLGVRLDSGDLAGLSVGARKLLDEAGFPDAVIVASNDLDEHLIEELKKQGAAIGAWGVGTRLVTGHPQAALGGVYKLSAIEAADGTWCDKLKLSEQGVKISTPGVLQVRRFYRDGRPAGDVIFDQRDALDGDWTAIDRLDSTRQATYASGSDHTDLLVPVFRDGDKVYNSRCSNNRVVGSKSNWTPSTMACFGSSNPIVTPSAWRPASTGEERN